MKTLFDLVEQVENLATEYVDTLQEVLPEDLGLDRRSAYRLFVGKDVIAVPRSEDGTLRYYGGFEYVGDGYREQLGNWVFYSSEDERVGGHLAQLRDDEENK